MEGSLTSQGTARSAEIATTWLLKESGLVQNVRELNGGALGGAEDLSPENSMQASLIGRFERIQGFPGLPSKQLPDLLQRDDAHRCGNNRTRCAVTQGQPHFAGSNFTSVSTFRNFQRQNQFAPRPLL